ncbi:hypothetical protein IMG5_161380 [Ichthyophthirius multifiliis]|uniref:Uncharacterized protein n=1 Tax=Ichthyophthirius multifiliis TaxID=5932 RepID=G0R030_ICHMU|nr:hypothetical protein IMG5_161380 [Ichthyophthirius multifiliis]EGR29188.1 hypothetical protein IMG5_161380 [Ichthyophthirius multifiliis]|eukprot:XP_004030424.1 hypothetical protein IMG5_161380 [Ichthyophthirius multifiliis]
MSEQNQEIDMILQQQAFRQNIPINFLREKIYPELYEAFLNLIDHVTKTDEIRKHQEKLKRKKVFDKLEQKKIEKERLKMELGSEYESSDEESLNCEEFGLEKEELQKILNERQFKKKDDDDENQEDIKDDNEDSESLNNKSKTNLEDSTINNQRKQSALRENLGQIEENEEREEGNENDDILAEREKIKNQLKEQRESMGFNPLKFLALKLKEIHYTNKNNEKNKQN